MAANGWLSNGRLINGWLLVIKKTIIQDDWAWTRARCWAGYVLSSLLLLVILVVTIWYANKLKNKNNQGSSHKMELVNCWWFMTVTLHP